MNREIKFRAKSTNYNHEWICGDLIRHQGKTYILSKPVNMTAPINLLMKEVDENTIGQYTGIVINGINIYEGDIITWNVNNKKITAVIYYDELQARFLMIKSKEYGLVTNDWMVGSYIKIGNIYDDPDLINKK